jgi:hypothetical protein
MIVHDSITEEIRAVRHELAAQFNNDVKRIGEDLRRRQAESGRQFIRLASRPSGTKSTPNNLVASSQRSS